VHTRISNNDGQKCSTRVGQCDPRVASLRTGPEMLVSVEALLTLAADCGRVTGNPEVTEFLPAGPRLGT